MNATPAKNYVLKFLIAFDMLVATLIWRDSNITISAFTGLALRRPAPPKWARILGGVLDWISPGHCAQAIVDDAARSHAALAILESK
jgi:hypothetical protein